MSDPTAAIWSALHRDPGVAVLVYPDPWSLGWVESEAHSLAGRAVTVVASVDEALRAPADHLVLLIPTDEVAAVHALDGSRDRVLNLGRTAPMVLFLRRDGVGWKALYSDCPSLASWVEGSDPDPDALAQIDVEAERARFVEKTGQEPEAWLDAWDAGTVDRDGEGIARLHDALLLVGAR